MHGVKCTRIISSLLLTLGSVALFGGEDEAPPVLKRVEVVSATEEARTSVSAAGAMSITLEVNERPLSQVLDYLRAVSGKNIAVLKKKDAGLLVTFKLENVTYRAILDFIARKYGMIVDDSQLKTGNIIYLDTPEKVSMVFNRADIREVINAIAIQSSANIVIGPEVTGEISMRLENVPWNEALSVVVRTLDFAQVVEANNTIRITSPAKIASQFDIRIFRLSYLSPEGSRYTAVLKSEFAASSGESGDTGTAAKSGAAAGSASDVAIGTSLLGVFSQIKSPGGTISFEKRSNAIVVRDTATALDQMQSIIDKLDVPPKQVHVSVKLVELSDADSERIGVNWNNGLQFAWSPLSSWASAFPFDVSKGLSNSLLGKLAVASGPMRAIDPLTRQVTAGVDLMNLHNAVGAGNITALEGIGPAMALGSMGFGSTSALMELFRTKTSGRVIQAPQLIALDHEPATIQVGEMVRYAESFVANTEGGGNVSGFREAGGSPIKLGLQLLIIPHVTGPENNIMLTAIPKTESFSLNRGGGGAPPGFQRFIGPNGIALDLPQTNQRIVVTKFMLRNGETGVIGGLRDEREDLSETKVPVFGEIPFLGRLFRHNSRSITGSNLLVFVTPTIVDIHETEQLRKDLDKVRNEFAGPMATPLGEDSEAR